MLYNYITMDGAKIHNIYLFYCVHGKHDVLV